MWLLRCQSPLAPFATTDRQTRSSPIGCFPSLSSHWLNGTRKCARIVLSRRRYANSQAFTPGTIKCVCSRCMIQTINFTWLIHFPAHWRIYFQWQNNDRISKTRILICTQCVTWPAGLEHLWHSNSHDHTECDIKHCITQTATSPSQTCKKCQKLILILNNIKMNMFVTLNYTL